MAQPFEMDRYVIQGAGGMNSGATYVLSATAGQAAVGLLNGGHYTLDGGFWPGLAAAGEQPTLRIEASATAVIISWQPDTPGFVLETSPVLGTPSWASAPPGNPVTIPLSGTARFYRVKKP